MRKKHTNVLLTEEELKFVEQLSNITGIKKSSILSFTLELLRTYFTEDQLRTEASMFQPIDGRRNE